MAEWAGPALELPAGDTGPGVPAAHCLGAWAAEAPPALAILALKQPLWEGERLSPDGRGDVASEGRGIGSSATCQRRAERGRRNCDLGMGRHLPAHGQAAGGLWRAESTEPVARPRFGGGAPGLQRGTRTGTCTAIAGYAPPAPRGETTSVGPRARGCRRTRKQPEPAG